MCVFIFVILILIVFFFGDLQGKYMESKTLNFFEKDNYWEVSTSFAKYNVCNDSCSFRIYDFKISIA